MPTGYVISDLHMFARWSKPKKYIERMGGALFTHGDLFWRDGRNPFDRCVPAAARRISPLIGWVYHLIHTTQATRLVHAMWPARRCADHIAKSLADAPEELTRGITDVYCGHTHVAVSDFEDEHR